MATDLSLEGKNFISASEAGRSVGYTSDYVAKLARDGKLEATRVGRQWYVTIESVRDFISKTEEEKKIRGEEIRQERLREQEEYKRQNGLFVPLRQQAAIERPGGRLVAATETLLVLVIGLTVGMSGYFMTHVTPSQLALASESDLNPFERFAIFLYDFVMPEREVKEVTNVSTEIIPQTPEDKEIPDEDGRSMIVAPEENFSLDQAIELRESFSDPVTVTPDPVHPDIGIITPHFKSGDGEPYRYLVVPVHTDSGG